MSIFGRKGMTGEEARGLVCCTILMVQSEGPGAAMSPRLRQRKDDYARRALADASDIVDWGTSLAFLEKFSAAEVDSPAIAEIFRHIIAKSQYEVVRGIFAPIKQEGLLDLDLAGNFSNLWQATTNNANSDIVPFLKYLEDDSSTGKTFHNITASLLLNRINGGISGYERAVRSLIVFGYSMEELTKIDNFGAWDLGRCGHLAKLAAAAGFIDDDTALQYMVAAGRLAYAGYLDWRQFLAAFFIGRAIVAGNADFKDFGDTIQYLLKNKKSPYKKFPLKSA